MSRYLEHRLKQVINHPPHRTRLQQGLAMAYTPPDANGRCKLMLSRRPKNVVVFGQLVEEIVYPSSQEADTVKKALKNVIGGPAFETLNQSVQSQIGTHGCVALFWYQVNSNELV